MGNENERAGKFQQAFFENFKRGNIEIVCRFVKEKHVGRLKHQLRDQNARAFAAGEPADGTIEIFSREQKTRGPRSDVNHAFLVNDRIAVRRERTPKQDVGIEASVLVKIDDAQIIGFANFSVRRLEFAKQQTQQRAFAAAVRPDKSDTHAGRDAELNFFK